jgi:hypothetical protein
MQYILRRLPEADVPWDSGRRIIEAPHRRFVEMIVGSFTPLSAIRPFTIESESEDDKVDPDLMLGDDGSIIYRKSQHRFSHRYWGTAVHVDYYYNLSQTQKPERVIETFYKGADEQITVEQQLNGSVSKRHRLDPRDSLELSNHSPDGFAWGYNGSGPAQTALGLLFDVTKNVDVSLEYYQVFKWEKIASIPQDGTWVLSETEIRNWLTEKVKK